MVKLRVNPYKKRYMRKKEYYYKRYSLTVPTAIGETLDRTMDYAVRLFGPAIIYFPKGQENILSRLEKLETSNRENTADRKVVLTGSVQEDSKTAGERD